MPSSADWHSVLDMAYRQNVVALAADGVQLLYDGDESSDMDLDKPEYEDVKYELFAVQLSTEEDNKTYAKVIDSLSDKLQKGGFGFRFLKGHTLAPYWPCPGHRPVGDIDFYILPPHRAEDADHFIASTFGMRISKSVLGHHSHFVYKGILVENHYELSNSYFGGAGAHRLEAELRKLMLEDSKSFNAVFLIWHKASHFCSNAINLKQLCDWCLFISSEYENIDWQRVQSIWRKASLDRFAFAVCEACVRYLGMDSGIVPNLQEQKGAIDSDADKIMEAILFGEHRSDSGFSNLGHYRRNAWRYRITGKNWFVSMVESVWMHIFHRGDMEETII